MVFIKGPLKNVLNLTRYGGQNFFVFLNFNNHLRLLCICKVEVFQCHQLKYTKGEAAGNLSGCWIILFLKGLGLLFYCELLTPRTHQPSSTSSTTQSIVPGDERMLYYCPNVCRSLHLVVRLYNCVSLALLLWELLSLSLVSQSVF